MTTTKAATIKAQIAPVVQETPEQEIARLRAENEALKANVKPAGISFKVTDKGACSVYHGGRFPVTLYREQWMKILAVGNELTQFLKDNEAALPTKAESMEKKAA